MTKVLQISNYYHPARGGIEQTTRDMARAMFEAGDIEQKVICFNEDASDGELTCHKSETCHDYVDGIEVIRCGYELKVSSQALSLSFGKELKNLMEEFDPDIVIFHYPNPFMARYLLQHKDKKFKLWIYWHLDITKQTFLKWFFHGQTKALISRADRVLGTSPVYLEKSDFASYFGNKKTIQPSPIDERSLQITDEEIKLASQIKKKHKVLGFFIGRHVPYKGLQYLIDASKLLGDEEIHFIIAGTGKLTEELKQRAKGDPKVEFVGKITDSQRRVYLYACDIFCFPSITKNEAFGLALAEGMYFGKPAVTFTIPGSGVNYVSLDGITGIECPNRDTKAYAEALRKLAKDKDLRLKYGQAAKERVLNNFSQERFKENVRKLLKNEG